MGIQMILRRAIHKQNIQFTAKDIFGNWLGSRPYRRKKLYTLEEGMVSAFVVDVASGIVRTSLPLYREIMPFYQLTVDAIDQRIPQLFTIVPIMVDITNINDIIPLFSSNQLEFVIKENF